MPASKPAPDTLTKPEACELLGKSPRSLVDYVKAGRLPVEYVSGPTGRQAQFARADIERLKRELETPLVKQGALVLGPRPEPRHFLAEGSKNGPPTALAPFAQSFAEILRAALPPPSKPWLTLDEAVKYSGLPRTWLLQRARDGWDAAVDVSGGGSNQRWRFNREALGKIEAGK